jgi:putative ABC transport system substrate-binding protein
MRRREFVSLIGGAAAARPLAARAQQAAMPVIGSLNGKSPAAYGLFLTAFRRGLSEAGYIDRRKTSQSNTGGQSRYEQLPALAADLVRRLVAVFAATSTPPNIIAAKATKTIPIVFTTSSDPVELGLVASLNQPVAMRPERSP